MQTIGLLFFPINDYFVIVSLWSEHSSLDELIKTKQLSGGGRVVAPEEWRHDVGRRGEQSRVCIYSSGFLHRRFHQMLSTVISTEEGVSVSVGRQSTSTGRPSGKNLESFPFGILTAAKLWLTL